MKETATTKVYVDRRGLGGSTHEQETRAEEECAAREEAGRYFVRVLVTPKTQDRCTSRSSTKQIGASAGEGTRNEYHVNITSDRYDTGPNFRMH